MAISYNTSIVRDSLVFNIDASNIKSYPGMGSIWYDKANNYQMTLFNSPAFVDSSFQFRSASSTYATTTFDHGVLRQANQAGSWSIEVFFKYVSAPGASEAMIAGRAGCHGGIYAYTDNTLRHAVKTTEANCWTGAVNTAVVTMVPGNTYHSVMAYNNGLITHYVQGITTGTSVFDLGTYNMSGYSTTFFVGGISGRYPNVDISVVRCYSRDLTADEVKTNYEAMRGRYGI